MPACGSWASSSNSSAPMCVSSASVPTPAAARTASSAAWKSKRLASRAHLDAQPQARHRLVHVGDERPADAHGEVEARLLERAVGRVAVVVEQVDAAAERDLAVDAGELAVHAAPALGQRRRASRCAGLKTRQNRPAAFQRACHSAGISPVPMPSTTTRTQTPRARGALERLGDRERAAGEIEDVGLDQHLGAGARRSPRRAPANSAEPLFSRSMLMARPQGARRAGDAFAARHRRPIARLVELELGDQRQVVRHARPGRAARHAWSIGSESRACRCGPSRTAAGATGRCCSAPAGRPGRMRAIEAAVGHRQVELVAPVVEVAGDDHRARPSGTSRSMKAASRCDLAHAAGDGSARSGRRWRAPARRSR